MVEDWARPVVHWHIEAREQDRIRDFYRAMFNWTIADGPLALVEAGIGAPEPEGFTGHIFAGDAPRVVLYVQVRDLAESLARASRLGGSVVSEPIDVPNGPTIARIADPEGNHVVLLQQ